jgi:hypothetical protein
MISATLIGVSCKSRFYAETVGFVVAQGRALDVKLINNEEFLSRVKDFYAAVAELENK